MANAKISQLPAVTSVAATDLAVAVASGTVVDRSSEFSKVSVVVGGAVSLCTTGFVSSELHPTTRQIHSNNTDRKIHRQASCLYIIIIIRLFRCYIVIITLNSRSRSYPRIQTLPNIVLMKRFAVNG